MLVIFKNVFSKQLGTHLEHKENINSNKSGLKTLNRLELGVTKLKSRIKLNEGTQRSIQNANATQILHTDRPSGI